MTARALLAVLLFGSLTLPLPAAPAAADDAPTAYVLCYHIVESPNDSRMEISRETFRQQMRYLAMTGYTVIPLRDLYEYVVGKRASIPKNSVVITFDDGWRSTYTEAFPELQRRKFPFTVFIYPKIIGQTSYALTWKQVREMAAAGVDIQSHSLSHPYLPRKRHSSKDEKAYATWLTRELGESKSILERETGKKVEFLAYPYGDYDDALAKACARAGYSAALTCDFGRVKRGSDPLRMKRFVIDKRMDFAEFRGYLGASPMKLEQMVPLPQQVVEPAQPVVISARIPNHKSLDPKSVRMALVSSGVADRFSYDARDGSISMVVRDAVKALQGRYHRALVWATELQTGKRVEATWTFQLPSPATEPVISPPTAPVTDATASSGTSGSRASEPAPLAARTAGGAGRAPRK